MGHPDGLYILNCAGRYAVKFFVHGSWTTVVVDDWIPCIETQHTTSGAGAHLSPSTAIWEPAFSSSAQHGDASAGATRELWPLLLEKAWAKLHGSYEAIAGGYAEETLHCLTGGTYLPSRSTTHFMHTALSEHHRKLTGIYHT